jgi:hypothetical protein
LEWKKHFIHPFGIHARAPPRFPVSRDNCHTEFLTFLRSPPALFLPRASAVTSRAPSIDSDGKYCGDNDAHLDRINVFYHEASGSNYILRAVLFDFEPGVIGAVRVSPLGDFFRPGNLVN